MEFWFARKHVLWVLINLICLSGYESCLDEERLGLLSIRDNFKSNGVWTGHVLPSWTDNLASDCCKWEQVKCNSTTGRVIELFLNYTGSNPRDEWFLNLSLFLPFEELHSLDLHQNSFTSCYQNHDLENLKNLAILDLSENNLHDSLATLAGTDLGHMTSLKVLSLAHNKLKGSLAQEGLCTLKNLEELDLSNNNLRGIIPSCLGKFTSLRLLDLSSNNLEGDVSSFPIDALRSLEYVDIRNNLFSGQFSFYSITNHTNLEVLMLSSDNDKLEVQTHYSYD